MNTPNEDQTHAEPQQPATGRAVTNTAAIGSPFPAPVLATLFPGSIERMEAAGQTELVLEHFELAARIAARRAS